MKKKKEKVNKKFPLKRDKTIGTDLPPATTYGAKINKKNSGALDGVVEILHTLVGEDDPSERCGGGG